MQQLEEAFQDMMTSQSSLNNVLGGYDDVTERDDVAV